MTSCADHAILIFAKAPIPGLVKTRLLDAITASQAAALQARLTHEMVAHLSRASLGKVSLYCYPDSTHPFFRALARKYDVSLRVQQGKNLGQRMAKALTESLEMHRRAVLVGSDCPSLSPNHFQTVFEALDQCYDVALGPAEDGGYVLIGLNKMAPEIFQGISWGTSRVLAETRDRIVCRGLRLFELPMQWDLDRPADLARYQRIHQRNTTCNRR